MNYRTLGRTGIRVSEIGIGGEGFAGKSLAETEKLIDLAMKNGINIVDIFNSEPAVRDNVGTALSKYPRDSFVVEGHMGSAWDGEQYYRTRDMTKVKEAYEDFFHRMQLDYVDIGMIHYVDDEKDFTQVCNEGLLDYAKELKATGKIRVIGMSTHNPEIALMAAESGEIDVMLFSINAAYDMLPASDDINILFEESTYDRVYQGIAPEREKLYQICQREGVALTVMKAFGAGTLLSDEESPFGKAMTPAQCIGYCLDRPAVAAVIGGFNVEEEVLEALKYVTADEGERDYSQILANAPRKSFLGHCMYCGHCAPCPVKIDVAAVNKFLDLAQIQHELPETLREHYGSLQHHAEECIACGSCMSNCPFNVDVISKMKDAVKIFGK